MLRQLAISCRHLLHQQQFLQSVPPGIVLTQSKHSFRNTASAFGLEEFFEAPLAEDEKPRTGERRCAGAFRLLLTACLPQAPKPVVALNSGGLTLTVDYFPSQAKNGRLQISEESPGMTCTSYGMACSLDVLSDVSISE